MDATLKKILQMLNSDDVEIRRASVRLLVELGSKEKEVIERISDKLKTDPDQLLKSILLDYIFKNPNKIFLPLLIELLKEFNSNREKIIAALAAYGDSAVPLLIQIHSKGNELQQKSILTILSNVASQKACEFLFDSMKRNRSLDHLKFICYLIKTTIEKCSPAAKATYHKCLIGFYKENKKDRMLGTSCLILFGCFRDPADKTYLTDALLLAKGDFNQRKHALNALSQIQWGNGGKKHEDLIDALIPQLADSDFPNIVRVAISILERLEFSKKHQKELQQLLNSTHPSVRSLALQKFSGFDSAENVDTLIKHLDSNDLRIRQAAQRSLEQSKKAMPKVLKLFESAQTFEQAERLVQILKSQRDQFHSALLKRCYLKMEQLLRKGNETFRHYLLLIRTVNPEFLYVNVIKKYKQLKSKKKWLDASNCLSLLENVVSQNHELRLESAICKLMLEKIDYSIISRDRHQGLLILQGIAKSRSAVELSKLFLADKKIAEEVKYFVGFHFSEKDYTLKEFGVLILKSLSKKKGKVAKLAKKKLDAVSRPPSQVLANRFA